MNLNTKKAFVSIFFQSANFPYPCVRLIGNRWDYFPPPYSAAGIRTHVSWVAPPWGAFQGLSTDWATATETKACGAFLFKAAEKRLQPNFWKAHFRSQTSETTVEWFCCETLKVKLPSNRSFGSETITLKSGLGWKKAKTFFWTDFCSRKKNRSETLWHFCQVGFAATPSFCRWLSSRMFGSNLATFLAQAVTGCTLGDLMKWDNLRGL